MQGKGLVLSILMVLVLALTACASDDDPDTDASGGSNADSAASTEANSDDEAESDDAEAESEDEEAEESESDAEATDEESEADEEEATAEPEEDEEADESESDEESVDGEDESGSGGEIEIEHAQGTTTVPVNPETVAVFDYSVADSLNQLDVEIAGLAGLELANLPSFLGDIEGEPESIGTLFEPDYEQVNALDPDLIIVAGRSSSVYGELADMAPTIDLTVDSENFLPSYKEQVQILGEIFEKQDEVEEALADVDESVERIQTQAGETDSQALIVMVSGGEVTAYGPGSRFGMIHDLLGVPAVEEDIESATHGDAISFEFIQEMNPDILYVMDRDAAIGESGEAAQEVLDNELVHSTSAWTEDKMIYLDTSTWYLANAGLGTFPSMLAEVEESLQ